MEARETQAEEKNAFGIWIGSAAVFALACFLLAAVRRPPDLFLLAGGLGLVAAAAAWALQGAWKRSQQRWDMLQQSVSRYEVQKQTASVVTAEAAEARETAEKLRREEAEHTADRMCRALEDGLQAGFASLAPALAGRMESALAGFTQALESERGERERMLREIRDAYSDLQAAQRESAQTTAAAWEKWREQNQAWHQQFSARETGWQAAWERVDGAIAALPAAAAKLSEEIRGRSDGEWKERLREFSAAWSGMLGAVQTQVERSAEALIAGAQAAKLQSEAVHTAAATSLRAVAQESEDWLRGLQTAGQKLEGAFAGAQRFGEAAAAHQADLKAVVEMLEQAMTGVLDRLQSLAGLGQGHEALLAKMDAAVGRFEERAAELLEENALKAQETLLDVLDRTEAPDAEAEVGDPDLMRAAEGAEPRGN